MFNGSNAGFAVLLSAESQILQSAERRTLNLNVELEREP
jgi:hypothetical protein